MELEWSRTESYFQKWSFTAAKDRKDCALEHNFSHKLTPPPQGSASHPCKAFSKKRVQIVVWFGASKSIGFLSISSGWSERRTVLLKCISPPPAPAASAPPAPPAAAAAARWTILIRCTFEFSSHGQSIHWTVQAQKANLQSGSTAELLVFKTWKRSHS